MKKLFNVGSGLENHAIYQDGNELYINNIHGGISIKIPAATLTIHKQHEKYTAALMVMVYDQCSSDMLLRFSLVMPIEQAEQLHAAVPELDFNDARGKAK